MSSRRSAASLRRHATAMKAAAAPAARTEDRATTSARHELRTASGARRGRSLSIAHQKATEEPAMQPDTSAPGSWNEPKNILVILAHPDDPEFFCGATLAYWARAGHSVTYYLLTCGDKGYNDRTKVEDISSDDLCALRHEEQAAAAKVIGAQAVYFLERPDGYLVPDMELRRAVVRLIRRMKPD